jgi:hypothetical protein
LYWAISHLLLNRSSLVLGDFLKTVNGPQSTYNFKCELKGRKGFFRSKKLFQILWSATRIQLYWNFLTSNRTAHHSGKIPTLWLSLTCAYWANWC